MGGMDGCGFGAGLDAALSGLDGRGADCATAAVSTIGGLGLLVPGTGRTVNNLFRLVRREATSSLVVVCGFNWAASCQCVSLPGAAPLSV
jgi:hypothetical protein